VYRWFVHGVARIVRRLKSRTKRSIIPDISRHPYDLPQRLENWYICFGQGPNGAGAIVAKNVARDVSATFSRREIVPT
jgi:hypothetical protein